MQALIIDSNPLYDFFSQKMAEQGITVQYDGFETIDPPTFQEGATPTPPADTEPVHWRKQISGFGFGILESADISYISELMGNLSLQIKNNISSCEGAKENETMRVTVRQYFDTVVGASIVNFVYNFDTEPAGEEQ